MKNVWKIFQRDMMRVRNNVIALVVIIGISVVPCLYAWFNIAASWDPYSNTGNLKVAVASVDEGYEGSCLLCGKIPRWSGCLPQRKKLPAE